MTELPSKSEQVSAPIIRYVVTEADYPEGWTAFLIRTHRAFDRAERRRERRERDRTPLPQTQDQQDGRA